MHPFKGEFFDDLDKLYNLNPLKKVPKREK